MAGCEQLWKEGREFKLSMTGRDVHTPLKGGSLKAYLENKYRDRIDAGQLRLHGAMPHAETLAEMTRAKAVLFPGLWNHFPDKCMEAMTLGKVVIASDSGGQARTGWVKRSPVSPAARA